MKAVRIALVVVALPLIFVAFYFFKPPLNYFAVTGLSTIIVWSAVFTWFKQRRWAGMTVGALLQLAIQQVAYHAWLADKADLWWPLVQFIALQYVIALRLSGSRDDTPATPAIR
jgi:hypothetical protein